MLVSGFAPIGNHQSRLLILGSLPGQLSLEKQEYYAHPQNGFWSIMGALFGAGAQRPYHERVDRLLAQGVAVWDVCQEAIRPGSLDANIVSHSVIANDFAGFFVAHPNIQLIAFNGAAAQQQYKRLVVPTLTEPFKKCPEIILPSTSPTHAALSLKDKLQQWSVLKKKLAQFAAPPSSLINM
jgi:double-stranded uracil-DNA glycosylase